MRRVRPVSNDNGRAGADSGNGESRAIRIVLNGDRAVSLHIIRLIFDVIRPDLTAGDKIIVPLRHRTGCHRDKDISIRIFSDIRRTRTRCRRQGNGLVLSNARIGHFVNLRFDVIRICVNRNICRLRFADFFIQSRQIGCRRRIRGHIICTCHRTRLFIQIRTGNKTCICLCQRISHFRESRQHRAIIRRHLIGLDRFSIDCGCRRTKIHCLARLGNLAEIRRIRKCLTICHVREAGKHRRPVCRPGGRFLRQCRGIDITGIMPERHRQHRISRFCLGTDSRCGLIADGRRTFCRGRRRCPDSHRHIIDGLVSVSDRRRHLSGRHIIRPDSGGIHPAHGIRTAHSRCPFSGRLIVITQSHRLRRRRGILDTDGRRIIGTRRIVSGPDSRIQCDFIFLDLAFTCGSARRRRRIHRADSHGVLPLHIVIGPKRRRALAFRFTAMPQDHGIISGRFGTNTESDGIESFSRRSRSRCFHFFAHRHILDFDGVRRIPVRFGNGNGVATLISIPGQRLFQCFQIFSRRLSVFDNATIRRPHFIVQIHTGNKARVRIGNGFHLCKRRQDGAVIGHDFIFLSLLRLCVVTRICRERDRIDRRTRDGFRIERRQVFADGAIGIERTIRQAGLDIYAILFVIPASGHRLDLREIHRIRIGFPFRHVRKAGQCDIRIALLRRRMRMRPFFVSLIFVPVLMPEGNGRHIRGGTVCQCFFRGGHTRDRLHPDGHSPSRRRIGLIPDGVCKATARIGTRPQSKRKGDTRLRTVTDGNTVLAVSCLPSRHRAIFTSGRLDADGRVSPNRYGIIRIRFRVISKRRRTFTKSLGCRAESHRRLSGRLCRISDGRRIRSCRCHTAANSCRFSAACLDHSTNRDRLIRRRRRQPADGHRLAGRRLRPIANRHGIITGSFCQCFGTGTRIGIPTADGKRISSACRCRKSNGCRLRAACFRIKSNGRRLNPRSLRAGTDRRRLQIRCRSPLPESE